MTDTPIPQWKMDLAEELIGEAAAITAANLSPFGSDTRMCVAVELAKIIAAHAPAEQSADLKRAERQRDAAREIVERRHAGLVIAVEYYAQEGQGETVICHHGGVARAGEEMAIVYDAIAKEATLMAASYRTQTAIANATPETKADEGRKAAEDE